eukprot:m.409960 g.409960  ORF g.409960 m.409960 type:complete len:70 (+) comp16804_c0_seq17:505-714(+)
MYGDNVQSLAGSVIRETVSAGIPRSDILKMPCSNVSRPKLPIVFAPASTIVNISLWVKDLGVEGLCARP